MFFDYVNVSVTNYMDIYADMILHIDNLKHSSVICCYGKLIMINEKHRGPEKKRLDLQEPVKKPIRQCPNSTVRHHIRNQFSPWSADV